MRIGMRLLLGYFLIVAVAAWFVLSIFVQEIKPGVRRATEGTLIDTATLLAALARGAPPAGCSPGVIVASLRFSSPDSTTA